jgi:hypothetical protein
MASPRRSEGELPLQTVTPNNIDIYDRVPPPPIIIPAGWPVDTKCAGQLREEYRE